MPILSKFLKSRAGTTSIEYGLIVVLLSMVVIGGISKVQDAVRDLFEQPASKLNQGLQNSGSGDSD